MSLHLTSRGRYLLAVGLIAGAAGLVTPTLAQRGGAPQQPEAFKGITASGTIEAGLFPSARAA
jgi:hypothetical protein